ncbi:MAG: VWA domain-containing protein, partial [Bacteroidota bacterium]
TPGPDFAYEPFMKGFWLVVFCLLVEIASSQTITVDRLYHHFGTLEEKSDFFTDFVFTNKTGKKAYILRIEADKDISSRISSNTLLPDSSVTVRLKYNPLAEGKFSKKIKIHLSSSDQPVILTLNGDVLSAPATGLMADCPDFSSVKEVSREMEFALKIKVIDKLSGVPIENAQIKIIYKGLPKYVFETPESGSLTKKIPLGYYYFVTSADEYYTNEFDAFVNNRNNELLIELAPKIKTHPDPIEQYEELVFSVNPSSAQKDTVVNSVPQNKDSIKEINQPSTFNLPPSKDTTQSENEIYAHNNLVFLIDISSSMMAEGKLDLLKASMIELTKMLDANDRIAIVVYSTHARIALPPVSGDRKEEVINMIQNLEGDGLTAGAEGMKKAYELAMAHFITGGNNMVIMATDGAFNLYTTDVVPMVKKYFKKGIHTSVAGIKNTERDAANMIEIATQGRGRYVAINNLEQAMTSLTEEVKTASRRE